MSRRCLSAAVLVFGIGIGGIAQADSLIRDQHSVTVEGVKETWQLVWDAKPQPVCGPDDMASANSCPCAGTAYGEQGKLSLIRKQGENEIERMALGPLFGQFDGPDTETPGSATLIRRPMLEGDFRRAQDGDPTLQADIAQRPAPPVMRFADYDHDGLETEFLLQVGTLPCGKVQYAAIGISAANPHLHAIGSAAHPDAPLVMPLPAWHALLSKPAGATVEIWACGDHGSEHRVELALSATKDGIHAHEREFSCPEDGSAGTLMQESDW